MKTKIIILIALALLGFVLLACTGDATCTPTNTGTNNHCVIQ